MLLDAAKRESYWSHWSPDSGNQLTDEDSQVSSCPPHPSEKGEHKLPGFCQHNAGVSSARCQQFRQP